MCEGAVVVDDFCEVREFFLVKGVFVADELGNTGVLVVVGNESDELWEVIAVPFSDTHGEEIDILVELVEEGNSLNNHIIHSVDVEL